MKKIIMIIIIIIFYKIIKDIQIINSFLLKNNQSNLIKIKL